MTVQHCGRLDKHPPHEHVARPRKVATRCTCNARVCECPAAGAGPAARKQVFTCTGSLVTEGAPPHLPVQVGV